MKTRSLVIFALLAAFFAGSVMAQDLPTNALTIGSVVSLRSVNFPTYYLSTCYFIYNTLECAVFK